MISPTSPSFYLSESPPFGSFDEQDPIFVAEIQNQRVRDCLKSVHYYLIQVVPLSEDAEKSLKIKGSILNSPSNTEVIQDLGKQLLDIPSLESFRKTPLIDSLEKAKKSLETEAS